MEQKDAIVFLENQLLSMKYDAYIIRRTSGRTYSFNHMRALEIVTSLAKIQLEYKEKTLMFSKEYKEGLEWERNERLIKLHAQLDKSGDTNDFDEGVQVGIGLALDMLDALEKKVNKNQLEEERRGQTNSNKTT